MSALQQIEQFRHLCLPAEGTDDNPAADLPDLPHEIGGGAYVHSIASDEDVRALVRDEIRRYAPDGRAAAELRRYLGPQLRAGGGLSPLGVAGYAARLRPIVEILLAAAPGLRCEK